MLSILLVSRDVSLFADIFLRLGLKKIGHEFKQDSVDLQIFFGEIVRGGRGVVLKTVRISSLPLGLVRAYSFHLLKFIS